MSNVGAVKRGNFLSIGKLANVLENGKFINLDYCFVVDNSAYILNMLSDFCLLLLSRLDFGPTT